MNLFKAGNVVWNLDHIINIQINSQDSNILNIVTTTNQFTTDTVESWALYNYLLSLAVEN